MDVNVPLLRKTLDWAYGQYQLAERGLPSEWTQGDWILRSSATECGTTCCIAGKIALEAGWKPTMPLLGGGEVQRDGEVAFVADVAQRELGLTGGQAEELFAGANTIERLYRLAGQCTSGEIQPPPELDLSASGDDEAICSCGCGMRF